MGGIVRNLRGAAMQSADDPHRRIRHSPGRIPCNAARGAAARPPSQGRQLGRNLNARGAGPRRGMPCRRAPAQGPARPEA